MPITKSHSKKSKIDRQTEIQITNYGKKLPAKPREYAKTEALIDEVYVDIANGVSKSDIRKKIELGLYETQSGKTASRKTGYDYYNAALGRFAEDCDVKAEELRQIFYGRYESLLEAAIKKNDLYNARGILDSMARIFGVEKKTPDTAIMINSDKENGITINFGIKDESENIDET